MSFFAGKQHVVVGLLTMFIGTAGLVVLFAVAVQQVGPFIKTQVADDQGEPPAEDDSTTPPAGDEVYDYPLDPGAPLDTAGTIPQPAEEQADELSDLDLCAGIYEACMDQVDACLDNAFKTYEACQKDESQTKDACAETFKTAYEQCGDLPSAADCALREVHCLRSLGINAEIS